MFQSHCPFVFRNILNHKINQSLFFRKFSEEEAIQITAFNHSTFASPCYLLIDISKWLFGKAQFFFFCFKQNKKTTYTYNRVIVWMWTEDWNPLKTSKLLRKLPILKTVRGIKQIPEMRRFWTWSTRLYHMEQVQSILQPDFFTYFANFRIECKSFKLE